MRGLHYPSLLLCKIEATGCDVSSIIRIGKGKVMFRWLLVIFIALLIFSSILPWLEKFGVGRLPGDLRFSIFGKKISLPFASTILLSTVIFLIGRFI